MNFLIQNWENSNDFNFSIKNINNTGYQSHEFDQHIASPRSAVNSEFCHEIRIFKTLSLNFKTSQNVAVIQRSNFCCVSVMRFAPLFSLNDILTMIFHNASQDHIEYASSNVLHFDRSIFCFQSLLFVFWDEQIFSKAENRGERQKQYKLCTYCIIQEKK